MITINLERKLKRLLIFRKKCQAGLGVAKCQNELILGKKCPKGSDFLKWGSNLRPLRGKNNRFSHYTKKMTSPRKLNIFLDIVREGQSS